MNAKQYEENAHKNISFKNLSGRKRYYLGKKYFTVYFTQKEALCMKYLLKGYSYKKVALTLQLSVRTVMFYSANMRAKVNCSTKKELIEKVKNSDFLHYLDDLK